MNAELLPVNDELAQMIALGRHGALTRPALFGNPAARDEAKTQRCALDSFASTEDRSRDRNRLDRMVDVRWCCG